MSYKFIRDDETARQSVTMFKQGETFALDIEGQGLDPHSNKILLIQIGFSDGKVNIYDARKINPEIMKRVLDYLFEVSDKLLLANASFDLKFLMKNYDISPPKDKVIDVLLNEWVLYNGLEKPYYSYKYLVEKYCGVILDKEIRNEFIDYEDEDFSDEMIKYAADDVTYIFDIASTQSYYLIKNGLDKIAEIEGNACITTAEMELEGVLIDTKKWLDVYQENVDEEVKQFENVLSFVKDLKINYEKKKTGKVLEYDFSKIKFNPNSPDQPLAVLLHRGAKYKTYVDGKLKEVSPESTGKDILGKIDDDFAKAIIKYREVQKEIGTYGINFLKDINPITGRIHCQFNQQGARSGRYSSSNPNLQNLPAKRGPKYRKCFVERDGWVQVTSDFSQFEMRLATEFSQDEVLLKAFAEEKDLHALSAAAMYEVTFEEVTKEQRSTGKTFNFSVLYGAQAFTVAQRLEIPYEQAEILVTNWRKGFPGLAGYLDRQAQFIRDNGWMATGLGRKRYFNWKTKGEMNAAVREGCNHPIQGAAGDVLKIAQCEIFYKIKNLRDKDGNRQAFIIRNVHDEITIRSRVEIADVVAEIQRYEMIKAASLYLKTVPIKVDTKISEEWEH